MAIASNEDKWSEVISEGVADAELEEALYQHRGVNTSEYLPTEVETVVDNLTLCKEKGNAMLAEKKYAAAVNHYTAALKILHKLHIYSIPKMSICPLEQIAPAKRPSWLAWEKARTLALALLLNLTQVYLCQERYHDAIDAATAALEISQRKSAKALYRRACAKKRCGQLDTVVEDLVQAAKLEPQNRIIREELEEVRTLRNSESEAATQVAWWAERSDAEHLLKDRQAFKSENDARCAAGKQELSWEEWVEKDAADQIKQRATNDFMAKYGNAGFNKYLNTLEDQMQQLNGGTLANKPPSTADA